MDFAVVAMVDVICRALAAEQGVAAA